eukprot:gene10893-14620_t
MNPISCFSFGSNENFDGLLSICFVKLGDLVGLPFLNHAGINYDYLTPCNCNIETAGSGNCNKSNFISGFCFGRYLMTAIISNEYYSKYAVLDFFVNYYNSRTSERSFMRKANSDVFNASFVGSALLRNVNKCSWGIWSSDSIFLFDSMENKLVDKSFTQLTQDYQKCVHNLPDVIYNAIGLSQGFVSLILPVMLNNSQLL